MNIFTQPIFVFGNERRTVGVWRDRARNPSLTILLALQLFLMFVALPMAAMGVTLTEVVAQSLLLVVLTLVVVLSHRGVAIVIILLGLAANVASVTLAGRWSPMFASVITHGGMVLAFSALTWVVAHAVFAPGRVTFHRLQGAVVVYLSSATIFAALFGLEWDLIPGAFANLPDPTHGPGEFATMLYFSLATLTTTGYGDIAPLSPFARSLANVEAVLGQFYLAITVARLVTLELAHRRSRDRPV